MSAHKQMLELPYYNTFFKTTTPPAVELSQVLADLTPPHLNYVFYGCSGSDANDTHRALRAAILEHGGQDVEEDASSAASTAITAARWWRRPSAA